MKIVTLCSGLLLNCLVLSGQNVIPNPGFELYSGCPTFYTQIDCVLIWTNPSVYPGSGGSPDYFNICASPTSFVDVPDNVFGYQFPHSGDAYCGIILWDQNTLFREYIQVPLTSTLEQDCYHFEMYVNLGHYFRYSSYPIGVYFSATPLSGYNNFLPLPFTPQINITGFTADTLNWIQLSGNYTAQGFENYLIIGNFNDDSGTVPSFVNSLGSMDQSYVFIDDVSLEKCSPSLINEADIENQFILYPNPVTDNQITIISSAQPDAGGKFELFDVAGRKIIAIQLSHFNSQPIHLPVLTQGIYQAVINNGESTIIKKVAVTGK